MPERQLIIAHADCYDGLTAAWVARLALQDSGEYYFARHGDPPPDVTGRHVRIFDFCYPRETLLAMHTIAASLLVIDHHKTAQDDCGDLPFCTFDMKRSGAGLAWEYFFRGIAPPRWLLHIEDRDLWRFEMPGTAEVHAFFASLPMTFEAWDAASAKSLATITAEGTGILRYIHNYCEKASKEARVVPAGDVLAVVVNVPYQNASEMAGVLLRQHPECQFSAGWFHRADGKVQVSLRSRPDFDVSEIAKQWGGGGHAQAAGFATHLGSAVRSWIIGGTTVQPKAKTVP